MPVTFLTTVKNIDKKISNQHNATIVKDYYKFMNEIGNSERYQKICL
jgi:hypothetical protein